MLWCTVRETSNYRYVVMLRCCSPLYISLWFFHSFCCGYSWYATVLLHTRTVKLTLQQPIKTQTGNKGIALICKLGGRWGWVVKATLRLLYPRETDPLPVIREDEWASEPVCTDAENRSPTGIRSPEWLHRLSHAGPHTLLHSEIFVFLCTEILFPFPFWSLWYCRAHLPILFFQVTCQCTWLVCWRLSVISGSLSPRHGASSGRGWRNGLQYGEQLRLYWISSRGQPIMSGPPAWGLGEVLRTPH